MRKSSSVEHRVVKFFDSSLVNNSHLCIMEVIETLVTEAVELEENTSVVSNFEADKTKAEFVWTLQATWQLVHTRLEMDQAFDQPVCKKKKLWEMVSDKVNVKLREAGNHISNVKAYECDLKWRNMLATYRKNSERAKRLGVGSVHWEFFKAMHDVLGKSREEVEAQRKAKLNGTKLGKVIASKKFTPILPTPSLVQAPFPTRPPQDVLQLYMELQERKMNMWAQQKALEERKIEAINNLAQAISSLAQNNPSQLLKE